MAFDIALCLVLMGSAAAALFARAPLAAIAFFVVFGNLMGLAWLSLGATDVALTEIAIGAGVTGIVLLRSRARLLRLGDDCDSPSTHTRLKVAAAAICTGLVAVLAVAVLQIGAGDRFGAQVAEQAPALGVKNPVTAVLLGFRGYDTLLETFVLLGAVAAVWTLARSHDWPHAPAPMAIAEPSSRTVTDLLGRLLLPVALVLGTYLVWSGSDRPGGAFQGATVLAGGYLLAAMGGAVALPGAGDTRLRIVLAAGPAVFVAVALGGIAAGALLTLPPGLAKALIVTVEHFLAVSIAAMLVMAVAGRPSATVVTARAT